MKFSLHMLGVFYYLNFLSDLYSSTRANSRKENVRKEMIRRVDSSAKLVSTCYVPITCLQANLVEGD